MLDTVEIKVDRRGNFKLITSSDSRISVISYGKEQHGKVMELFNELMSTSGVYILTGSDEDGNKIYIGEGDSASKRIENAKHRCFNEKWVENVLFINSKDFNKSFSKDETRYIESKFIEQARNNDDLLVQNKNAGQNPQLTKIQKYELNFEIARVLEFLNYIDNNPFISTDEVINITSIQSEILCTGDDGIEVKLKNKRGSEAHGIYYPSTKKILVKAGSKFVDYIKPSSIKGAKWHSGERNFIRRFEELKKSEKVKSVGDYFVFAEDVLYKTVSGAGRIFTGGACNGWTEWRIKKNNEGLETIRDVMERSNG